MKKITELTYVEVISSLVVAYEIKNFMFRNYLSLYTISKIIDMFITDSAIDENIIIDVSDSQEERNWLFKATSNNIRFIGVCVSLYGEYEFYEARANDMFVDWVNKHKDEIGNIFC